MTFPRVLHTFMQRPLVNLGIALSLALGISGTSAVLNLADNIFERGAPGVYQPRSLAKLYFHDKESGSYGPLSYPNYRDYANASSVFESLAAEVTLPFTVSLNGNASRLSVSFVSSNFFSTLRPELSRGRSFTSLNEAQDVRSAIISNDLWRHAGSPSGLSRLQLEVNGSRFIVVGVASPGFHGASRLDDAEVWIPAASGPQVATGFMPVNLLQDRESRWFDAVGRLRPGVTFQTAQAEVKGRSAWLERLDPNANQGKDLALGDWHEVSIGTDRSQLARRTVVLGVAAALVLFLACANVANILAVRNWARRPEIALRFALGANRAQIGRLILAESLLISLVGGALSIGLVAATGSLWASIGLPVSEFDFRFDLRSSFLTFAVSMTAGVLIAAVSAMLTSQRDLSPSLKTAGLAGSRSRETWHRLLVICEVALALASVALSALLAQSLSKELTSGFGFDPGRLAVAQVDLDSRRYSAESAHAFYREFLARIRSDRRISAASIVRFLPLDDTAVSWKVYQPDKPVGERPPRVSINRVGTDFFRTIGLPIVAGQDFPRTSGEERGAIVSESLARKFWPNRSAIGQRLSLIASAGPFLQVIGVAQDTKWSNLQKPPTAYLYLANTTDPNLDPLSNLASGMQFIVRTHGDPRRVLADLRRTAAAMDPSLRLPRLVALEDYISRSAKGERDRALLLAALAAICLALCAIGVYAVLSQMLVSRAQELAIRLALGASPAGLWRAVFLRGSELIVAGTILGIVLTLGLGRLVQSQLYEIAARDSFTLAGATLGVLGMGLCICWVQGGRVISVASRALLTAIRRQ